MNIGRFHCVLYIYHFWRQKCLKNNTVQEEDRVKRRGERNVVVVLKSLNPIVLLHDIFVRFCERRNKCFALFAAAAWEFNGKCVLPAKGFAYFAPRDTRNSKDLWHSTSVSLCVRHMWSSMCVCALRIYVIYAALVLWELSNCNETVFVLEIVEPDQTVLHTVHASLKLTTLSRILHWDLQLVKTSPTFCGNRNFIAV